MDYDDDDDYLDSLRRERLLLPLRGNPLGDSNYDLADERQVGGARAFAATAPDFVSDVATRTRARTNRTGDTQGSRFRTVDTTDSRLQCWQNNHVVNHMKKWGSLKGPFPVLAPITELVKIKHAIYDAFTRKMIATTGDWTDKIEFFLSEFEEIAPAASAQGEMAMSDLQDPNSDAFVFSDMEILDANLEPLTRGNINAVEFPQASRHSTRFLRFTLTAHPRLTNPGALDIDQAECQGQQATTVIVRALQAANGTLRPEITKHLLETNPKLLLQFYAHEGADFDICIKSRYDAAPDPERHDTWIREVSAKTKYQACKQIMQKACVGRLEGIETLAQRLQNIRQRQHDKATQRVCHLSV